MDLKTLSHDYEIWLYGSRARGDTDDRSDTDLLVIGDDPGGMQEVTVSVTWPRPSASFYSWHELRRLWSYGSLFLDHVRREGHPLRRCHEHPERFSALLATLPPFARARHDLNGFRHALDEGEASLADHGWPDVELRMLATVARHAAILGCYCLGRPVFGRLRPFEVWTKAAAWNVADARYLAVGSMSYRFAPLGAREWKTLEAGANRWLALARRLLDEMEDVVDQYEATLHQAA